MQQFASKGGKETSFGAIPVKVRSQSDEIYEHHIHFLVVMRLSRCVGLSIRATQNRLGRTPTYEEFAQHYRSSWDLADNYRKYLAYSLWGQKSSYRGSDDLTVNFREEMLKLRHVWPGQRCPPLLADQKLYVRPLQRITLKYKVLQIVNQGFKIACVMPKLSPVWGKHERCYGCIDLTEWNAAVTFSLKYEDMSDLCSPVCTEKFRQKYFNELKKLNSRGLIVEQDTVELFFALSRHQLIFSWFNLMCNSPEYEFCCCTGMVLDNLDDKALLAHFKDITCKSLREVSNITAMVNRTEYLNQLKGGGFVSMCPEEGPIEWLLEFCSQELANGVRPE